MGDIFMSKKYYVLYERSYKVKGGPYSASDLMNMARNGQIRKSTPIQDKDGIGTDAESIIFGFLLSTRQRAYLRFLGYSGSLYISQDECSKIIEKLRNNPKNIPKKPFEEYLAEEENNQQYENIFNKKPPKNGQNNPDSQTGCLVLLAVISGISLLLFFIPIIIF
jgi:hypothetical protein